MAIFGKFWNGVLIIGTDTDLSDHVQSAKLTIGKEVFDLTVFGDVAKVRAATGLEDHSLAVSFLEDMASSKVYATLYAMWVSGTGTNIEFKLDSGADGPTNPRFKCNYILSGGQLPIGGAHGALLKTDVTFISAGPMTFDVTP